MLRLVYKSTQHVDPTHLLLSGPVYSSSQLVMQVNISTLSQCQVVGYQEHQHKVVHNLFQVV